MTKKNTKQIGVLYTRDLLLFIAVHFVSFSVCVLQGSCLLISFETGKGGRGGVALSLSLWDRPSPFTLLGYNSVIFLEGSSKTTSPTTSLYKEIAGGSGRRDMIEL